jgi:4-amino-4-deoxy-L-arabinose transferase-like glycosyltransferase
MNSAGFIPIGYRDWLTYVTKLELIASASILVFALASISYANLPSIGVLGAMLNAFVSLVLGAVIVFSLGRIPVGGYALKAARIPVWQVLTATLAAQIAIAIITSPAPGSDSTIYLELAARLAAGESYLSPDGHRAFWPPGLPFFLTPFVYILGPTLQAITVGNVGLFLIGGWAVLSLGRRLGGENCGRLALLLYALWPSRLLMSGLAAKEFLTFSCVAAGLALLLSTPEKLGLKRYLTASTAGFSFGVASLAQPGLLLLVIFVPFILRGWLPPRERLTSTIMVLVVAAISYAATIAPWHARNCLLFEGEFCGLATNGGSVLYRANNPLATGLWTPDGQPPIAHLPEIEQNRLGYELAKQWIVENPVDFIRLGARKLQFLLADDEYGAYWAIRRGLGDEAQEGNRYLAYRIAAFTSLAFWFLLCCLLLRACQLAFGAERDEAVKVGGLFYPLLYSAIVFSVFESGDRQHIVAMSTMLVIASWGLLSARSRPSQP